MLRLFSVCVRLQMLEQPKHLIWLLVAWWRFGNTPYTLLEWAARRYPQHLFLENTTYAIFLLEVSEAASALSNMDLPRHIRLVLRLSSPRRLIVLLFAGLRLGLEVVPQHPKSTLEVPQGFVVTDDTAIGSRQDEARFALPPNRKNGKIILATSGTTGKPKLVAAKRTSSAVLAGLLEKLSLESKQKILLTLPLVYGQGLATLMLCVLSGSMLYCLEPTDPINLVQILQNKQISVLVLVPTILHRLVETRVQFRCRAIITGSAPLAVDLAQRTQARFGRVLFNLYGSSEHGLISLATPHDLANAPASVGQPLQAVQIKDNQIWLGKTNTLDTGYLEHGRLFLTGRQDEMLICGGINVYPHILEQQIARLEGVTDCAVQGIPDSEYGTAILLFVVLEAMPRQQLEQRLAQILPKAQRPKAIIVCQALPRTALGKLKRHELNA